MNYQISRNGNIIGIYSHFDIMNGLMDGTFLPSDYYWTAGMAEWKTLYFFKDNEVSRSSLSSPQPEITTAAIGQNKKSKTIWAIVAFLFPYIGYWKIIFDKKLGYSKTTKAIYTCWFFLICLSFISIIASSNSRTYNPSTASDSESTNEAYTVPLKKRQIGAQNNSDSFSGEVDSSDAVSYIGGGINLLMSQHTNTEVSATADNTLIITTRQSLNRNVKGVPLLKLWIYVSATVAGKYLNDHPESGINEIWFSDYSNLKQKQIYVLKVSVAKKVQDRVFRSLMSPIPDGMDTIWDSLDTRTFE
jgi:hypothetical protein